VLSCAALGMITGCCEKHPKYPTYDELTQRGFYVYVLPESEVERREWSQTISIWSWDRHCRGYEVTETSNPIHVRYDGLQSSMTLRLGPWSLYWDHREPTTDVKLDSPWAMDGTAVYYTITEDNKVYVRLKFKDRFGIPVYVSSNLSITEVVQLLNQLEYRGPNVIKLTNGFVSHRESFEHPGFTAWVSATWTDWFDSA